MKQLNLFGISVEKREEQEREKRQLEFYQAEHNRLVGIRGILIYSKSKEKIQLGNWDNFEFKFDKNGELYFDDDFEKKKFLGEWWYCNHIKGWNNNVPAEDLYVPCVYDGVAQNELMSETIRDCFISVERDNVRYDKKFAIERLDKAIEGYDKLIKELEHKLKKEGMI